MKGRVALIHQHQKWVGLHLPNRDIKDGIAVTWLIQCPTQTWYNAIREGMYDLIEKKSLTLEITRSMYFQTSRSVIKSSIIQPAKSSTTGYIEENVSMSKTIMHIALH